MYRPYLVHSPANGHVACLYFVAVVFTAAMNNGVQIALQDIGYIPRSGMLFSIFYSFLISAVFIPLN